MMRKDMFAGARSGETVIPLSAVAVDGEIPATLSQGGGHAFATDILHSICTMSFTYAHDVQDT
jgi:hypothetical protein